MDSEFEAAFLLHQRPFQDTSIIAELFCLNSGRVPLVVRGAKGSSIRSRDLVSSLQPFQHLEVRFQGRGEMKKLIAVESEQRYALTGQSLYAALYLNELTLRLLHRQDPHPQLWLLYRASLERLQAIKAHPSDLGAAVLEPVLRHYELGLLEQLGYGLEFGCDGVKGDVISGEAFYRFELEAGFIPVAEPSSNQSFAGNDLLALAESLGDEPPQWTPGQLRSLKKICRMALSPLLGDKPLKSRELFGSKRER